MKFQIRYALSGGFGGCEAKEWEDAYASTRKEAEDEAYTAACEEYESYDGLHGLRSVQDIIDEDEVEEGEAEEVWREERESWLDYEVREVPELVTHD